MGQRLEIELQTAERAVVQPRHFVAQFFSMLLRHKKKAVAVFLLILVAFAVLIIALPRSYVSEGKLFIRLGRENVTLDPTVTLGQGPTVVAPLSRDNEINSVAEIIKDRNLLEKVVDAMGPSVILGTRDEAQAERQSGPMAKLFEGLRESNPYAVGLRDKAIKKLAKKLSVEPAPRTNVVVVAYKSYDPAVAQAVVNHLIDLYLQEHLQLNRARGAHDFLAEQMEQSRARLAASEADLRKLMDGNRLISVTGRRESLVASLNALESAYRDNLAMAAATEAHVKELAAQLRQIPKVQVTAEVAGVGDHGTDLMRSQLYGLQTKVQELASRYADDHPQLRQAREQLAAAAATLDREDRTRPQVTKAPVREYEEIELTMRREQAAAASLRAKGEAIAKQMDGLRREMAEFNRIAFRIQELERDTSIQEVKYRKYAENAEQAKIDRALELQRISNVSVAQPATYDPEPTFPNPLLMAMVALGIGLFGALGTAYLAEYLEGSIKTAHDIERHLKLPILASIPQRCEKEFSLSGGV